MKDQSPFFQISLKLIDSEIDEYRHLIGREVLLQDLEVAEFDRHSQNTQKFGLSSVAWITENGNRQGDLFIVVVAARVGDREMEIGDVLLVGVFPGFQIQALAMKIVPVGIRVADAVFFWNARLLDAVRIADEPGFAVGCGVLPILANLKPFEQGTPVGGWIVEPSD